MAELATALLVIDAAALLGRDAQPANTADLAESIECLIQDRLPPVPVPDRHWFFGMEGGPRML
ncbi:hypothetical protein Vqi01_00620 [Micromonospora qiuiae]|uniref:Uncharacterized protein n=1 Tax=Micromonospora qiuiae TaxID=502268 RepID=A0ABQ4J407_9ACTN|nr:hypothetical protein [Micromonospora qiuiae]GIJ24900.1 hypothetical protein Vqi01_00620 [Micromonospora qiuiae]